MSIICLLPCYSTICSLFTPCVACVTPLCMKATFGTTFSSSPKLCQHYRDYGANQLYGTPRWQKESWREAVEAIWDIPSRAEKKKSRIIFGLRNDKQICDLQLGQRTVAGNGRQRHRGSWLVCRSEQTIAVHYFLPLRTVDLKKTRHHISVWNYIRRIADNEESKYSQKVAG